MKLHLGCWHRYTLGFVHVDLCDMKHIDYQSRIDNLPIFKDNTASIIYSSHSFECFDKDEANIGLKQWYRILKPNGIHISLNVEAIKNV
jgi:predicted SAM-dependent methyltransferase